MISFPLFASFGALRCYFVHCQTDDLHAMPIEKKPNCKLNWLNQPQQQQQHQTTKKNKTFITKTFTQEQGESQTQEHLN